MLGRPVIGETRITVQMVLKELAARESVEQVLAAHPPLSREAVSAALSFAAEFMKAATAHTCSDGEAKA